MSEQTPIPRDPITKEPVSIQNRRKIPARTKEAIRLRVEQALTWNECAERVGMREGTLFKALSTPHVNLYLEEQMAAYAQQIQKLRGIHKARAYEVARHLMDNAKSEAVRMRAVEFFAGEAQNQGVSVSVNVNNMAGNGYEFAPPGAQIVTIRDSQSPGDDVQDAEIIDD